MRSEDWMRKAIDLARLGEGYTSPNPLVGAVVVKDGRLIGQGYHQKRGEAHAERNALAACREDPAGATVYVTLEPCCHQGKTPPCTEALIEAGIARVVIGSRDPNPKVSGGGVLALYKAGIQVVEDFLREECDRLNPFFFHYIQSGFPYVTLKYAMSADGKIAARNGTSQWITGPSAREHLHRLRHRHRAIMVGSGTVLQDDPRLTCRLPNGRSPLRIICDRRLRIPLESQICRSAEEVPTIIATHNPPPGKRAILEAMGVKIWEIPLDENQMLDMKALLEALGREEVDSILVEGGGTLAGSLLSQGLINGLCCFIGPKLLGGEGAKTPIGGLGAADITKALLLSDPEVKTFPGGDVLLSYEVRRREDCLQES